MRDNAKQIIERIGETDQLFLQENTPELALERADLRLQLVKISHHRQEQIHFLQEGIVLLEQARIEYAEMPMRTYINLSLHLAKAYMMYFDITQEERFALITKQILKPLTCHDHGEVFLMLASACATKNETALARHWLKKYSKTSDFDLNHLHEYAIFDQFKTEAWFMEMIKAKLN
ncbi:hypothetical protein G9F31_08400 [Acinetobacter sp. 187]|uniref:hypothetical protein n=1 Tax=Acinetobacter lanii TaxID=2715163 RepID=UPI00140A88DB|nr:hypothetical protein [Acinetobacter lanii]NHC03791.1 hypothetical protein [Acinetobacter lanii]